MNESVIGWIAILIMLPVVIITTVIPWLTRRIESFGVTIPETRQQHPVIARLRKQYLWLSGIIGLAATLSMALFTPNLEDEQAGGLLIAGHVIGYILLTFVLYIKQHYAVKRLKEQEKWDTSQVSRALVSVTFRNERLTHSSFWFVPHALLLLATALLGVLGYDKFPDMIPMHYGFDGEVTRAVPKSYLSVLWPAMVQGFLLIVFLFVNYVIGQSKQVVEASDPEGSLKRNVKFRRYWSAYLILMGFLLMALFDIFLISMLLDWSVAAGNIAVFAVVGAALIGSFALSMFAGQGGSRLKRQEGQGVATVQLADQDQYWKLGQFYFNRQDPALFVEKRFGIGWTVNFARPIVWLIFAAIVLVPLLISWLV